MAGADILAALQEQVAKNVTVEGSAKVLIDGFAARMQAAVDAAIANGATAEQLAPVTDEVTALKSSSDDLAASVAANTSAVDAAIANGATAEQQAPVTDEVTALKSSSDDLAAIVAANTSAA